MQHRAKTVCCDDLIHAFEEACRASELEKAAVLLADIDVILLGEKPGPAQREAAVRRMRALRTRLEALRKRPKAPVARMARALFG